MVGQSHSTLRINRILCFLWLVSRARQRLRQLLQCLKSLASGGLFTRFPSSDGHLMATQCVGQLLLGQAQLPPHIQNIGSQVGVPFGHGSSPHLPGHPLRNAPRVNFPVRIHRRLHRASDQPLQLFHVLMTSLSHPAMIA